MIRWFRLLSLVLAATLRGRCLVHPGAIALTAAMTLGLAACGGGTAAVVFGEEDLPGLVLHTSDVPKGLLYSADTTRELEANWTEGDESYMRLKPFGLQGVHFAAFESEDYGAAVTCGALLFGDSNGASRALESLREWIREGATDVAAGGLGEESWGMRGDSLYDFIYGFRVENAVVLLVANGDVDARGLAETAAERVSARQ